MIKLRKCQHIKQQEISEINVFYTKILITNIIILLMYIKYIYYRIFKDFCFWHIGEGILSFATNAKISEGVQVPSSQNFPKIMPLIILLAANSNILRWSDRYYFS